MNAVASFDHAGLIIRDCNECLGIHVTPWPRVAITRRGHGRAWGWRATLRCPNAVAAVSVVLDVNLYCLAAAVGAVDAGNWDGDGRPERVLGRVSA